MRIKKILIFGTGFIANNLIKYFNNKYKDIEFIVIYNKHKVNESKNIKQYSMNDNILEVLKQENPEYYILVHGDSFVSNNVVIEESVKNNVLKSSEFLENIYKLKDELTLKKIIVVGSASEYGKFYNEPIKESFQLHPTSIYGLSKIFLLNVFKYFVERGLPIVYVRQFNTLGVDQRDNFVLASFAKTIVLIEKKLSLPILKVGDLTQERDFLDIRDTCKAYELLLHQGLVGEEYNVASGEYINIEYLLNKVIEKSEVAKNDIEIISNKDLFLKEASLSKRLHANVQKLESLGFKKTYNIEKTIEDTLNYWRENV